MGRSLNDAGRDCSVPVEFLAALEEGDIDLLPPCIFALGILRTYCQYLDVPFEGYSAQLEEGLRAIESASPSMDTVVKRKVSSFSLERLPLALPKELSTWIAVCGLLFLGWFSYSILLNTDADPRQGQAEAASVGLPRDLPNTIEWTKPERPLHPEYLD